MFLILFKIWCNTNLFERDFLRYKNLKLGLRTDLLVQLLFGYFVDNHKENATFILTQFIWLRYVVSLIILQYGKRSFVIWRFLKWSCFIRKIQTVDAFTCSTCL